MLRTILPSPRGRVPGGLVIAAGVVLDCPYGKDQRLAGLRSASP
jgi:hypothetical protein